MGGNGEDSDDETDEIVAESSEAISYSATETTGTPFKTVTIIDASYSTYFATLVWMGTGTSDSLLSDLLSNIPRLCRHSLRRLVGSG